MSQQVLSRRALRQAAAQVRDSMLRDLPSPAACAHEFSPAFEEKMVGLIARVRRRERGQQLRRQAAAVFLVLLLGSGVWLSVDNEARASFVSWFREIRDDSVEYRFFTRLPDRPGPLPLYEPTWLPEGYAKTREDHGETMYGAVFKKEGASSLILEYVYATSDRQTHLLADKDAYVMETLSIHGMTAHFYQSLDPAESHNLIWIDEEANLLFSINSRLEKAVILRMAESIKLSNMTN